MLPLLCSGTQATNREDEAYSVSTSTRSPIRGYASAHVLAGSTRISLPVGRNAIPSYLCRVPGIPFPRNRPPPSWPCRRDRSTIKGLAGFVCAEGTIERAEPEKRNPYPLESATGSSSLLDARRAQISLRRLISRCFDPPRTRNTQYSIV